MTLTPTQLARLTTLVALLERQSPGGFSTYDIIHDARDWLRGEPGRRTYLLPDHLIVALARRLRAPEYRVAWVWFEEQEDVIDLKIAVTHEEQHELQASENFICWET